MAGSARVFGRRVRWVEDMGCILGSLFAKVAQGVISNEINLRVKDYYSTVVRTERIIVRAMQIK